MAERQWSARSAEQETRRGAALVLDALAAALALALVMFTVIAFVVAQDEREWPDLYWVVALPGATAALTLKLYAGGFRGLSDDAENPESTGTGD